MWTKPNGSGKHVALLQRSPFSAIISNQLFNNQVNKIYKLLNYKYYGNKNIYLYHTVLSLSSSALGADGVGRYYSAMSCLLQVFSHSFLSTEVVRAVYAEYASYVAEPKALEAREAQGGDRPIGGNSFITFKPMQAYC